MGFFGVELGSCPQIWKLRPKPEQKKGFRCKILGYYFEFTQFDLLFCPRKELYSLLGGTSSNLGGHSLEMPARGTGPATFFWGTILAWGAHFLFEGHQQ